ncbi:MAG: NDP-hexose 2,3-dehydratase family protein [Anaerolineales bacterium]
MKNIPDVETWFAEIRERSHLSVSKINFRDSAEWALKDGIITHRSGRFFQVAGMRYCQEGLEVAQPIIVQQEVGVLGFILHDHKLLAYAKVEPGNVGTVQLAPTCQATASNLDRVHGGTLPLFGEWFMHKNTRYRHDSLQSEQGMRFFKKQNRNVLLDSYVRFPQNETHKWLEADLILELMKYDFFVNTDARSTLVCSPWDALVNRKPFTRVADAFSSELETSFRTLGRQSIPALLDDASALRERYAQTTLIPLSDLTGWIFEGFGLTPLDGKSFEIFQISVRVEGRETPAWDQPIISSIGEGYVELVCGRINGLLHFLFTLQIEAGLYNIAELGPSLVVEPGSTVPENTYCSRPESNILVECRQSDEGGRFFQDVSTYRLIDIGEAFDPPQHGFWLTLAQTRQLLNEGGWFTNEARSVLSLLLTWL